MGDRGTIVVDDTGVVLYTHWQAYALPRILARALGREERWRDPVYLARIIFDAMTAGDDGPTGFGIGTEVPDDAWRAIHVDCSEQTIEFAEDIGFRADEHGGETYSFTEFLGAFGQ